MKKYELLSASEEIELAKRIKDGDNKALEKLFNHNLRLVVYVVKRMGIWKSDNHKGVTFDDIVQIGAMYLLKACREWEPRGDLRFSTFARRVIQDWTKREYEQLNNTIRLPQRKQERIRKIREGQWILKDKASLTNLAKHASGISNGADKPMTEDMVVELLKLSNSTKTMSLDGFNTDKINLGE